MRVQSTRCRRWRELLRLRRFDSLPKADSAALNEHLGQCRECQRYAAQLSGLTERLVQLGSFPIEPKRALQARWTAAVRSQARAPGSIEALLAWLAEFGRFLQGHRKPLCALAPIWVLILFFRLAAPTQVNNTAAVPARSLLEVKQVLLAEGKHAGFVQASATGTKSGKHSSPAQPRSSATQEVRV